MENGENHKLYTSVSFKSVICCRCSIPFLVMESQYLMLVKGGNNFYCPNGHVQVFVDHRDDEIKRLKREVSDLMIKLKKSVNDNEEVVLLRKEIAELKTKSGGLWTILLKKRVEELESKLADAIMISDNSRVFLREKNEEIKKLKKLIKEEKSEKTEDVLKEIEDNQKKPYEFGK